MRVRPRSWVAMILALVVSLSACTPASEAPTPTPMPGSSVDIAEFDPVTIESAPDPDWVTVTPQGVWVANVNDGLVRYDDDGTVSASVATGPITNAMEVGFGSLWLTSDEPAGLGDVVVRVDLENPDVVIRIPLAGLILPEESSLAVTDDGIWGVGFNDEGEFLYVIDPATNAVRATYPAPTSSAALRGGYGSLWVTRDDADAVDRVDPATGATTETIAVGSGPRFLTVGAGAVWVMNQQEGSVSRIDAADGTVSTIPVGGQIFGGDIAASDDAVWVRTSFELAVQIDPATLEVVRRIGPVSGSGSIAVDGESVWISAHDVRTVWRIEG